jgi:hypothetical protein
MRVRTFIDNIILGAIYFAIRTHGKIIVSCNVITLQLADHWESGAIGIAKARRGIRAKELVRARVPIAAAHCRFYVTVPVNRRSLPCGALRAGSGVLD